MLGLKSTAIQILHDQKNTRKESKNLQELNGKGFQGRGFPPSPELPLVSLQKVGMKTLFFTTPPAGSAVVFGGLIVFLGLLPQQEATCHFKIQYQLVVAEESVAWILGQGSREGVARGL